MGPERTANSNRASESIIEIDGVEASFEPGETIYEVAARLRKESDPEQQQSEVGQELGPDIPTLCYDPRLEPLGACRLCVVEVEGGGAPVASCTTPATSGMKVRTRSEALEQHRKTILEMVVSENDELEVDPLRGYASQELRELAERYEVKAGSLAGACSGESKLSDENPFILRDYSKCISCFRCVRVCAEQEGDYAIGMMNRGFQSQITTAFEGDLRDSTCTFCGQCVQTCPTGALADKKALRHAEKEAVAHDRDSARDSVTGSARDIEKTRTICPYCGVGCSVDLMTRDDRLIGVQPAMDGPANHGALCVKGQFAYDFVQHEDRLSHPLVRSEDGELRRASWDEALDRAAEGFRRALEDHGRHSIYAVASGRAPHEAAYTIQKFIRAGFGTNYIDNCSRA